MVKKSKADGIEALVAKHDPVSIQEITMLDWYASFALFNIHPFTDSHITAEQAFDLAEAMMQERAKRIL